MIKSDETNQDSVEKGKEKDSEEKEKVESAKKEEFDNNSDISSIVGQKEIVSKQKKKLPDADKTSVHYENIIFEDKAEYNDDEKKEEDKTLNMLKKIRSAQFETKEAQEERRKSEETKKEVKKEKVKEMDVMKERQDLHEKVKNAVKSSYEKKMIFSEQISFNERKQNFTREHTMYEEMLNTSSMPKTSKQMKKHLKQAESSFKFFKLQLIQQELKSKKKVIYGMFVLSLVALFFMLWYVFQINVVDELFGKSN